jgi:hypothetical protein
MSDLAKRLSVTGWGAIPKCAARMSDLAERISVTGWGAIVRMASQ